MSTSDVLFLRAPPKDYPGFWGWIKDNFPNYYSLGLYTFIISDFRCYSLDALGAAIASWNPELLIASLGPAKYDKWRTQLLDLTIIYNFAVAHLWPLPALSKAPFSQWFRYRANCYEHITLAFPKAKEYRLSLPPPNYTRHSPVVAREREQNRKRNGPSSQYSRSSHRSYCTTSPNLPTTESVYSRGSQSSHHSGGGSRKSSKKRKEKNLSAHMYPWQTGGETDPVDEFVDNRSYPEADPYDMCDAKSRRSRSPAEPWNRPAKPRSKINEKISWNGKRSAFREFRKAVEGHLLQVNAGYLIDIEFLATYATHHAAGTQMTFLSSAPFWEQYNVPFEQSKTDKQYLYGILVTACRQTDNKVILERKRDLDGILAWSHMLRTYDNGGSTELRTGKIDDDARKPYTHNYPGGLTAYVEQFQALIAEMDSIAPLEYTDGQKQRLLIKNIRAHPGVAHLAQHCKDFGMTYFDAAEYLAKNAVIYDHDVSTYKPKRMMTVIEEGNVHAYLTATEVTALFEETARESNIFLAHQSFQNRTIRQSLRIPDDVWHALEPTIKETINGIRTRIKEERDAHAAKALSNSKPTGDGKIPAQYPNMKVNTVETESDMTKEVAAMTAICETLGSAMTFHEDGDTDDEDMFRSVKMAMTEPCDDESDVLPTEETPITVHAHFEYTTTVGKNYGISDSGADSCCLGKHCHPVSYTGRSAVLVGYNPDSTRSGKVPIITGYLKVMSQVGIPVILCVHEAPYLQDSEVTLISEYQSREHGIAIDSVSQRHKTVDGTYGTQRMVLSELIHVPFVDRGGLLGFEILPWKDGDDTLYDIFDITRDEPWKPRRFRDVDETAHVLTTAVIEPKAPEPAAPDVTGVYNYMLPIVPSEPELYFFDPEDAKVVTLGHAAKLAIKKEYPQDTPADDLLAHLNYRELTGYESYDGYYDGYPETERHTSSCATVETHVPSVLDISEDDAFDTRTYAVASWHRVLHDNVRPEQLRPYLGWAPLRVIKKTIAVTTQMAKMVIRYPMRRHIRSRLSFMRAKRLNEVVSTDPMFANCKSFGPGWTGAQVFFGLKSTQMDIIGFKGKGEFPRCYRDYIRTCGVPSGLRRDNAKEEQSAEVDEIHRELYIRDEFSEPYNQQQNPVESRAIKYLKEHVHALLDRTGAPDAAWYHAAKYLCEIHSILSNKHLPDGMTPKQFRSGVTTDISPWLQFQFYQAGLYLDNEDSWPSSKERACYWLGVSENIGDYLTYWILDDQTKQVLARSVVRPYDRNLRVKWDPVIASRPVRVTAHHGGDIKPTASKIKEKMSNLEDAFDKQEPDPEPHFFDPGTTEDKLEIEPETIPTGDLVEPGTEKPEMTPMVLDTSLDPFVPALPDPYEGTNRLRFSRQELPIDPEILCFPRRAKKPYNDIRYKHHHTPDEIEPMSKSEPPENSPEMTLQPDPPENDYEMTLPPEPPDDANDANDFERPSRRPQRTRKAPVRFAGNMETVWRPGQALKAMAKAAMLGLLLLPNVIIAEPAAGLVDLGTTGLFPEATALQPIDATVKTERLRAYHARLDIINDAFSGEDDKADWQVQMIERYISRDKADGAKEVVFKVQWLGGGKSWVKMENLRTHDPFLVVRYGLRNKLTEKPGWDWVTPYLNSDTEIKHMIRAYKVSTEIAFKFGVQVPRNTKESLRLDLANGNKLWENSIATEFKQINDYETFRVLENNEAMPPGYKRIPYHCIYDVKFDGRRKCRLVAGGHRTDPPKEDIYSGVVSMEAVRLGFILARMNGLQVCAGDVGNAFLYGKTREKVFVIAGEEFGENAGKRMIIDRSLYGLKSSSARFHEHLSVRLRQMGYRPSKADPDLWLKKVGDHYEYVARFVDDVISFSKDPMAVMKDLEKHYVMKGVGKPQYYLGGDVVELGEGWIKEGIHTAFSAETYIKNCLPKLAVMCGKTALDGETAAFSTKKTPFSDKYHPELDETALLPPAEISKFKSLIGSGNWLITLGRFDIQFAISTMSQYAMAPRQGHMLELQRVFGYLTKYPQAKIPIDIADPPIRKKAIFTTGQQWIEFYPDASEDIPPDMLEPKGMEARLTVYVDADHARNKVTCRSVTGIIMLLNNTPLVWISKRQKTVETSTYGSELVAARLAIDLIIEMRYKLRMLGVQLEEQTMMLGDNMSVVLNTTIPSSSLKKKHLACAYHRVREAIAGKFVKFGHIKSEQNLADIGTKPLDTTAFHRVVGPYLFRVPEHLRVAQGVLPPDSRD